MVSHCSNVAKRILLTGVNKREMLLNMVNTRTWIARAVLSEAFNLLYFQMSKDKHTIWMTLFISKTQKILDHTWCCLMLLEGFFRHHQACLEVIGKSHKILVLMSLEHNLTPLELIFVLLEWILCYLSQYYVTWARYHQVLPKLLSCKWNSQLISTKKKYPSNGKLFKSQLAYSQGTSMLWRKVNS